MVNTTNKTLNNINVELEFKKIKAALQCLNNFQDKYKELFKETELPTAIQTLNKSVANLEICFKSYETAFKEKSIETLKPKQETKTDQFKSSVTSKELFRLFATYKIAKNAADNKEENKGKTFEQEYISFIRQLAVIETCLMANNSNATEATWTILMK